MRSARPNGQAQTDTAVAREHAQSRMHIAEQAEQHEQVGQTFHPLHDEQNRRQVDRQQQPGCGDQCCTQIRALDRPIAQRGGLKKSACEEEDKQAVGEMDRQVHKLPAERIESANCVVGDEAQ